MNSVDRIIRIIYKELDLRDYTNVKENNLNEIIGNSFKVDRKNNGLFKEKLKNKYLNIYPNNYNEDEVNSLLCWVESELEKLNLDSYCGIFLYVSLKIFRKYNGEVRIDFDKFLEWHGFMNKADYNIFYAAYLAYSGRDKFIDENTTYIKHDNDIIYHRLKKGIAENHMHLKGSGYTTEMNWYEFIKEKPYEYKSLKVILEDEYLYKDKSYILSFQKIRVIRIYLYLRMYNNCKNSKYIFSSKLMRKILSINSIEEFELLYFKDKINENKNLREICEFTYLLYENDFRKIESSKLNNKKHILLERRFLKDLFNNYYLEKLSTFEIYLLNVYLLGLNQFKSQFVQDTIGMGFKKFKLKENVKEGIIERANYSNMDIYLSVFDNYYSEKHVKYIEIRIAPKKSVSDYIKTIKEIEIANEEVYKKHKTIDNAIEKINYGIIIHYIKCQKEFNYKSGEMRKERTLNNLKKNKRVINRFFELKDDILSLEELKYKEKIVGIDTANYEYNFRPEVFGPIFREHRFEISENNNFNFTYHVGEDFNTLVNGLRAIDEVIEFLNFQRGDRLGHAIALGLDINMYFKTKRRKIHCNIEDYLDDISWMYQIILYSELSDTSILLYLEKEFKKYKNIYLKNTGFQDINITEYLDSYNLRGDDPELYIDFIGTKDINESDYNRIIKNKHKKYKLNYKNIMHKSSFFNKNARELYYAYNYNSKLKKASREVYVFDIDDLYIKAAKLSQDILRKKVYEKDIRIEVNPSSNKKISFVSRFIDIPLLQFNKYGLYNDGLDRKFNLPVSINTDDSAVFQTNLTTEYSFIVAALIREGYFKDEVYDYLDHLSVSSMEHNFININ